MAAIEQPLGRNMVEAMGVNAYVDLTGGLGNIAPISGHQEAAGSKPQELYLSNVELRNMYLMEEMLSALQPPAWPEPILGKIDRARAERGRRLYEEAVFQNALSPQEEQLFPDAGEKPGKASAPAATTRRWMRPSMVVNSSSSRCTSSTSSVPMPSTPKTSRLGTSCSRGSCKKQLGKDSIGIGEALGTFSTNVQNRIWAELWKKQGYLFFPGDSMADIPRYTGFRPNNFRAPLGYPARPMGGYWATAPFLHGGSVPNLYQLLSPANERSETFYTGNLEYDPVRVGYVSERFRGGFLFDTRTDGNGKGGHEFRNAAKGTPGVIGPALTSEQRYDIIEYMKVIWDLPRLPER